MISLKAKKREEEGGGLMRGARRGGDTPPCGCVRNLIDTIRAGVLGESSVRISYDQT